MVRRWSTTRSLWLKYYAATANSGWNRRSRCCGRTWTRPAWRLHSTWRTVARSWRRRVARWLASARSSATVNDDDLAGDVAAGVRAQQQRGSDDFIRRPKPFHQRSADHGVDSLLRVLLHHVSVHGPGRDGVDPNAEADELGGHRAGIRDHRRLCG